MAGDRHRLARFSAPRGAVLVAVYALAALPVYAEWLGLDFHLRVAKPSVTQRVQLPDLVAGTAERPYVLRALVPDLVRGIDAAVPVKWQDGLDHVTLRTGGVTLRHRLAGLGWDADLLFEYLVASLLTYAALVGFAVALRALYLRLFPERTWQAGLLPLLALGSMPLFFQQGAHFYYDFGTLLLFTVAFLAIAAEQWPLFYVAFVLAAVNKETAILLVLVFLLAQWKERPRPALVVHALVQFALWALVRGLISAEYRRAPGPLFEYNLAANITLMRDGTSLPHLVFFTSLLLAALVDLRRETRLVQGAFLTLVPLTAAYFVVGKVGEIRALLEVFPAGIIVVFNAVLALASTIAAAARRPSPA